VPRYRSIDHTADLGTYIYADTPEAIFVNAAYAMTAMMLERPPSKADQRESIDLEAMDRPALLVEFLNELLYRFQVKGLAVVDVQIHRLTDTKIKADIGLALLDADRHGLKIEIKAATYHQLEILSRNNGFRAKVIFDV
jgi:SHS2 domain-containing protein